MATDSGTGVSFALLGMQAAGMVTDWFATKQQKELGKMGAKLEQAGISANIEMTRLQTEDASLQAMKQLRQQLGSQIAAQAARGTATGAGSAASIFNESIKNFNDDERARRMNLLAKEGELRAQGVLSGLHQLTSETQLGQALTSRTLSRIPTSSLFGGTGGGNGIDHSLSGAGSYGMDLIS